MFHKSKPVLQSSRLPQHWLPIHYWHRPKIKMTAKKCFYLHIHMLVLRLFQKEEFWTCFKQEHIYYIYICRTEQSKTTNSSQVKWSDTGTLADTISIKWHIYRKLCWGFVCIRSLNFLIIYETEVISILISLAKKKKKPEILKAVLSHSGALSSIGYTHFQLLPQWK